MLSLNLFAQKAKSYRRLSTSTEGEGDTCISPGVSAPKEEHDADEDLLLAKRLRRPWHWSCMHMCGYLFVALLSFLIGLGLSQLFTLEKEVDGFIARWGSSHRNINNVWWSANASFAAEPSLETQETWESIMPQGRGFIQHPKLAKDGEVKAIAVFHEIHCLHGLRTAFYKNAYQLAKLQHQQPQARSLPNTGSPHSELESSSENHVGHGHDHTSPTVFKPNPFIEALLSAKDEDDDPGHITHCFEYLRQALMCAADTNLEVTHQMVGEDGEEFIGTEGWDTARVCRDYEAVKEWAEAWRAGDAGGII
ncbi:hypothetical protein CC77DRAFT_1005130 [Alternaria alternata]|uniref:Uncharacterized protein n=1 Tax=Alternaria alternata TaxID=5599 RepID=A0A177E2S0_ALTAL|nr:hypothetical protein CC77DRAFT_1005130 [Alternaria alternata]OAG25532.1 hypothetical protein CC77DRAFT_1005130 [Alternaria alternata]